MIFIIYYEEICTKKFNNSFFSFEHSIAYCYCIHCIEIFSQFFFVKINYNFFGLHKDARKMKNIMNNTV